jgi:hypothetical protein
LNVLNASVKSNDTLYFREQLRESVGVSTMRQSAIELARKQLSAHDPEKGHRVDLMTGVNRR